MGEQNQGKPVEVKKATNAPEINWKGDKASVRTVRNYNISDSD